MVRTSFFLGLLGLGLLASPAQAVTISLIASPSPVTSGQTVTIDIVASGFSSGQFVSAFDFGVEFDTAQLGFVADSFRVGSALGSVMDVDYFDFTDVSGADAGKLLPFVVSLLSDPLLAGLQPGPSVTLGSFELLARRTGVTLISDVGLSCNSVAGPLDEQQNAILLPIELCVGSSIAIEPVAAPEPGTFALLGLGLLGLAAMQRTQRGGART
jgi:hypothetical protein